MPQKRVPNLLFNNDRMHIEQSTELNFLGLIIDSLLAWGIKSPKIEQLQKKAVRLLYSKSPIVHTEPLFIKMNRLKSSDLPISMTISVIILQ